MEPPLCAREGLGRRKSEAVVTVRRRSPPKQPLARQWSMCLRIPDPSTSDQAPALDQGWLDAMGVHFHAPLVLRLLRDHVSGLIGALRDELEGWHFLVHDRESGVPTTADDKAAYLQLRLYFKHPIRALTNPEPFVFVRPVAVEGESAPAGIDLGIVKGLTKRDKLRRIDKTLCAQSELVLAMVDAHDWKDDADMVRQVRQVFHWVSNMLQMRIT